jgi:hypothetical protein
MISYSGEEGNLQVHANEAISFFDHSDLVFLFKREKGGGRAGEGGGI